MEICKYGDLYPLKMKNQGVKKKFQQLQQQVWWDVNDICVLALNGDTNMKTSKRGKTIKKPTTSSQRSHNEFATMSQQVHNEFTTIS